MAIKVLQRKLDRYLFGPANLGRVTARGQCISARTGVYSATTAISGLAAGRTYRGVFKILKAGSGLYIPYANTRRGGLTAHTTPYFVEASVKLNSGALVEVTHNGATEWQVDHGTGIVWVKLPINDVVPGDVLYVNTFARTAVDGQNIAPAFTSAVDYGIGAWYAEGNQKMNDSPTTINPAASYAGPMGVFASSVDVSEPCVGFFGESIMGGQGENTPADYEHLDRSSVGPGYLKRAAYVDDVAHFQGSVGSTKVSDYTNGLVAVKLEMMTGCTHVILPTPSNDLSGGDSAATVIANINTLIGWARDRGVKKVAIPTIAPRTTGTWTTLGGQTLPSWEADRLTVNAAILSGTGLDHDAPIGGAAGVESLAEPGKWEPMPYTVDGSHPNEAGHEAMAAACAADFATFMAS